jgi:hypothetical protein
VLRRAIGVVPVLAAATLLVAAASASSRSARDQALLASILSGTKTDLVSVRIGNLTPEWRSPARRGNKLLDVKSAATGPAGKVLDEWYAMLIAGAYDDQCGRKADHCLAAYAGNLDGSAIGRSGARHPYASRRTLSRRIRVRFAAAGLDVSSVSFEHPHAYAPVATVRSRHPQRAVGAFRLAVLFHGLHAEGLFVRMLDARSRVFLAAGGIANHSAAWVRPGLKLPNVP